MALLVGHDANFETHILNTDLSGNLKVTSVNQSIYWGHRPESGFSNYSYSASLSTGTNQLTAITVPSLKIWEIYGCWGRYTGTVAGVTIELGASIAGTWLICEHIVPLASNIIYYFNTKLILFAADKIRFTIYGATATDSVLCQFWGRQDAPYYV